MGEMSTIMDALLGIFTTAKDNGVIITIAAITAGIIFVVAAWLWGKAKQWLKKI